MALSILSPLRVAPPFDLQPFTPPAVPPILTNGLGGTIGMARFAGAGIAPARFASATNATRNQSQPVGTR